MAAISKTSIANKLTSTFWTKSSKVIGLGYQDLCADVPGTAKLKSLAYRVYCLEHTVDGGPHVLAKVGIGVTDKVQAMLSTTEKNIDAIIRLQESDLFLFVTSNQRHNDNLSLFSLEVVNGGHAQKFGHHFSLKGPDSGIDLITCIFTLRGRIFNFIESLPYQSFLVPFAENDLKVVAHLCA